MQMQIAEQWLSVRDVVLAWLSGCNGVGLRRLGRRFPRLCCENQLANVTAMQAYQRRDDQ
jgi:hypothetical protein